MYNDLILEYWKNPKNFGTLENPTITTSDYNPLCGDSITMDLSIKKEKNRHTLKDVKFRGHGCAISRASASILTELVIGKDIEEIRKMENECLVEKLGIKLSPLRVKCALLGLKVLKLGIYKYLGEKQS